MPGISYDESGSLASYFGVTCLGLILIPATFYTLRTEPTGESRFAVRLQHPLTRLPSHRNLAVCILFPSLPRRPHSTRSIAVILMSNPQTLPSSPCAHVQNAATTPFE